MVLASHTSDSLSRSNAYPENLNDPQVLQRYLTSIQDQQMGLKPPQPIPLFPWSWNPSDPMGQNYNSVPYPMNYSATPTPEPSMTPKQYFQFIDLTPADSTPSLLSMAPENTNPMKRQRTASSLDRTIDMDRSRVAQQRRRDSRGKFLREEVANRLEDLEAQLQEKEELCEQLRKTLTQKDVEFETLKQQFQQLITQRTAAAAGFLHHPTQYAQMAQSLCVPIQTTSRNFVLSPSPNPVRMHDRKPFMEKIDYSKIRLRKTDQLDEEKREVISMQEQWEERQRFQQFMSKMSEQAQWQALQFQQTAAVPPSPYYGGAPSNIYSEMQNKIGNLPVPAFTTKVDLTDSRNKLSSFKGKEEELSPKASPDAMDLFNKSSDELFQFSDSFPDTLFDMTNSFGNEDESALSPLPMTDSPILSEEPSRVVPVESDSPRSRSRSIPLGGPPSNIYPPPAKIGNLQVPAFTSKVNYADVPLRRTEIRDMPPLERVPSPTAEEN